jgi:hypothetical protein
MMTIEPDSEEFRAHSSDICALLTSSEVQRSTRNPDRILCSAVSSLRAPQGWKIEKIDALIQIFHPKMHAKWLQHQASLRDPLRRPQRACFLFSKEKLEEILRNQNLPSGEHPSTVAFAPATGENKVVLIVCDVLVGRTLIINGSEPPKSAKKNYDSIWYDMPNQSSTCIIPNISEAILPTYVCELVLSPTAAAPSNYSVPSYWQKQTATVALMDVATSGPEFQKVSGFFNATMKGKGVIKAIQRVQNTYLWQVFQSRKALLTTKGGGKEPKTLDLFHGTRGTPPKSIYDNDDGFDMRFSNSGMVRPLPGCFLFSYFKLTVSSFVQVGQRNLLCQKCILFPRLRIFQRRLPADVPRYRSGWRRREPSS